VAGLQEKLEKLEREVKTLEERISSKGQSQGWVGKHSRSLGRFPKGEMHMHEESE
jgi:hypothetical protein